MNNFEIQPTSDIRFDEGVVQAFHASHQTVGLLRPQTAERMLSFRNHKATFDALPLIAAWQKTAARPSHMVQPLNNTVLTVMALPTGPLRSNVLILRGNGSQMQQRLNKQVTAYVATCDRLAEQLKNIPPPPETRRIFVPNELHYISFS